MQQNFSFFFFHHIRQFPLLLTVAFISALGAGLMPVIDGLMLKYLINNLSQIDAFKESIFFIVIYACWWEISSWIWRCYDFCMIKVVPRIRVKIIDEMTYYVMGQGHDYVLNNFSGKISNKIADVNLGLTKIIEIFFEVIVQKTFMTLSSLICMFFIHYLLGITLLIWLLLYSIINYVIGRKIKLYAQDFSNERSKVMGNVVDIILNIINIRLFNTREVERKRLWQQLLTLKQSHYGLVWYRFKGNFVKGLFTTLLIISILTVMFYLKSNDYNITLGDFALVVSIMGQLAETIWSIGREINVLMEQLGICSQAVNAIGKPYSIIDKENAKELKITKGEIKFLNVSFGYGNNNYLFKDKSITIQGGTKVGLVGASGSGKTTFTNLINRMFEVNSGDILIDDQKITDVTLASLHHAISVIPQEPILFHRSIMENIRYGNFEANDEDVIKAAKKAQIHDFITSIGYNTIVGERGLKLSGGQRQRIAIARAFLKNSPIIIMDEATSSLDSITEENIQLAMRELINNKTVIIIAHRLSTLLYVDNILVFNKGKIIEHGSHEDLIKENGSYSELWTKQFKPYIKKN